MRTPPSQESSPAWIKFTSPSGLAKFGLFNTLDKEITEQTTVKMLEDALDQEYLDLN